MGQKFFKLSFFWIFFGGISGGNISLPTDVASILTNSSAFGGRIQKSAGAPGNINQHNMYTNLQVKVNDVDEQESCV